MVQKIARAAGKTGKVKTALEHDPRLLKGLLRDLLEKQSLLDHKNSQILYFQSVDSDRLPLAWLEICSILRTGFSLRFWPAILAETSSRIN